MRFGFLLAGEEVAEQFRQVLGKEGHREQPQGRHLLRSRAADEHIESLREALGLTHEQLAEFRQPVRRRPLRDVLIYLLWKNSDYTLPEIGKYFRIGYTAVGNARVRRERHLKRDRKLRGRPKELLWQVVMRTRGSVCLHL